MTQWRWLTFRQYLEVKQPQPTDKYEIAARIGVAGLDGFTGVMDAKTQKQIFGANVFGRKVIKIDASGQGVVTGRFSVCFGNDFCTFSKSFQEIADIVNGKIQNTW